MVTAFFAVLDPLTLDLWYAGAGHPPPLLVDPAGDVVVLDGAGPPLGVAPDVAYVATQARAPAGGALIGYTDGLIEYDRDVFAGERRLAAAARAWARGGFTLSASEMQDKILRGRATFDDAALLIVRFPLADDLEFTLDATPLDASRARGALERFVSASNLERERAADLVLASSEAIVNCVQHAYPGVRGQVRLSVHRDAREVRIVVSDRGVWREPGPPTHRSGRGFVIMRRLVDAMEVERNSEGTTVRLRMFCREVAR